MSNELFNNDEVNGFPDIDEYEEYTDYYHSIPSSSSSSSSPSSSSTSYNTSSNSSDLENPQENLEVETNDENDDYDTTDLEFETNQSDKFILAPASEKDIKAAFFQRQIKYPGGYTRIGTNLSVIIIANIEHFFRESQNLPADSKKLLKDVRMKRFDVNIEYEFLDQIKKRHSHIHPRTVFLIHVQLKDRAYWFAHNSIQIKGHDKTTMFGFYPFRLSRFQNLMVYDRDVLEDEIAYFKKITTLIRNAVDESETSSSSLLSQEKFTPFMNVYLLNSMVLNTESLWNFPSPAEYKLSAHEVNDRHKKAAIFLSLNFYDTGFFKYIIERNIYGKAYGVRIASDTNIFHVKKNNDGEDFFAYITEANILQNICIRPSLEYTPSLVGTMIDIQQAMESRKRFIHIADQLRLTSTTRPFIETMFLPKGNIFSSSFLFKIIEDACLVLTQFGLGVNVISMKDVGLAIESQIETNFVHDVLYGSVINNIENINKRAEVVSNTQAGFFSFVSLDDYGVIDFKTYKENNTRKIAAWLLVMKFVIKHGFKTPFILALFKDIFQFVHYAYCKVNNINPQILNVDYDERLICELIFLRLFGNPDDVDSHITFTQSATYASDAIPFTLPVYFHMGFFTIIELCDFFLKHRAILLEVNSLKIHFYGCFATNVQLMNWTMIPTLQNNELFRKCLQHMSVHTIAQNTDWNTVQESSINHHTIAEAVDISQPCVMFGNRRLFLNQLGNACRRIYLSSLPEKTFDSFKESNSTSLKDRKDVISPFQYNVTNLFRFLNSDREEIRTIALVLLNAKTINEEGYHIKEIVKHLEEAAFIRWYMASDVLEKKSYAMHNSMVVHLIHNNLSFVSSKAGNFRDAIVANSHITARCAVTRGNGATEEIFEKRKKLQSLFATGVRRKLEKTFSNHSSKNIQMMKPTKEEEDELYEDTLLISWFLQSPFYHGNRNHRGILFKKGQRGVSNSRRNYVNDLQTTTVASKDVSFNDTNWPYIVDSLQNLNNEFLINALTPVVSTNTIKNAIILHKKDKKTGIITTSVFHPKDLSSSDPLKPRISLLERIRTSSLLFPVLHRGSNARRRKGSFFTFFVAPSRYVYTASVSGKCPAISGSMINNLFEGYPLTLDGSINPSANQTTLSEEIYYTMVLFYQFMETLSADIIFSSTENTGVTFATNEYFPLFSGWFSQKMKNAMNSKLFTQFIKEKLLNSSLPSTLKLEKIALFKKMFFESELFKEFVTYIFGDIMMVNKNEQQEYSHDLLEKRFRSFIGARSPTNTRVKFVFDPIKISEIYNVFEQRTTSNGSSQDFPRMTVNWNIADTFIAYEYLRMNKRTSDYISPLHIFRTLSILKDEKQGVIDHADVYPIDPKNEPLFETKSTAKAAFRAFGPKGIKQNEYYAPITGYVTRAMDFITAIEYNERAPSMTHYATSRRSRVKEVLIASTSDVRNNMYYATGIKSVYDMDVRFSSTKSTQQPFSFDAGSQRLWSQITRPLNAHMVEVKYEQGRKQWYLAAKNYLIEGNVIGFIFGEVSPIEIFVESTDIYDPKDATLNESKNKEQAKKFSDYVSGVCENIFSRETLYPVDEYGWFQFTHVKTKPPVLYSNSVFESSKLQKPNTGSIYLRSALENWDISTQYKDETVKSILSPNAYREVRVICGYEIDGSRFSSYIRYVRYTRDPTLANAEFRRVKRSHIALLGKDPDLNYWNLTITRYIPAGDEIVVLIPAENNKNGNKIHWSKFLLASIPRVKLGQTSFGSFWDYPVKPIPILQKIHINDNEAPNPSRYSTSLPLFATRKIPLGVTKKLIEKSKTPVSSPSESHNEYIPVSLYDDLIPSSDRKSFYKIHKSFTALIGDMDASLDNTKEFPANLVIRPAIVQKHAPVIIFSPSPKYETQHVLFSPITIVADHPLGDDADECQYDDYAQYDIPSTLSDDTDEIQPSSSSSSSEDTGIQSTDPDLDSLDAGIELELATFGSTFTSNEKTTRPLSLQDDAGIMPIELEDYDSMYNSVLETTDESLFESIFSNRTFDYTANNN